MLIAVDLDHTLVNGSEPIEGARKALGILKEKGYRILIHTCNNPEWAEKVLRNNDIWFDSIWTKQGKPVADIYLDDHGLRFCGNWEQTLKDIENFNG